MNPKYVANLELSRRLKELGYPQKGEFWWVNSSQDEGYEGEIYWLCDKKWTLCSFLPQDGGEVPLSILKPGEAKSRYDDDAYAKEKELIKGIEYCHALWRPKSRKKCLHLIPPWPLPRIRNRLCCIGAARMVCGMSDFIRNKNLFFLLYGLRLRSTHARWP